jgi:hypothetical protein
MLLSSDPWSPPQNLSKFALKCSPQFNDSYMYIQNCNSNDGHDHIDELASFT